MGQKYVYNALTCEYDIINEGEAGPPGRRGAPGRDGSPGRPGVGVPAGGTKGQHLVKKTNADHDTEWVTDSSSVAQDLKAVLTVGNSAMDAMIILAKDDGNGAPEAVTSQLEYDQLRIGDNVGSGANTKLTNLGVTITGLQHSTYLDESSLHIQNLAAQRAVALDADSFGFPVISLKDTNNGGTTYIRRDGPELDGHFVFEKYSGVDEVVATREWVADNTSGGGTGTQDLDAVLTVGNTTDKAVIVTDGTAQSVFDVQGSVVENGTDSMTSQTSNQLKAERTDQVSSIHLGVDTGTPEIKMETSLGNAVIKQDGSTTSGTFLLPGTTGDEVVATREWVTASVFPTGDSSSRTPYETNGQMYLDTTISKPIWYITGTGWIDATGATV